MSKQAKAKESQGYVPKLTPQACMNCGYFRSEVSTYTGRFGGEYTEEKNIRCGLGGFAVKKMGTCNEWLAIEA